jgi:fatty-acyl-CoA synthase
VNGPGENRVGFRTQSCPGATIVTRCCRPSLVAVVGLPHPRWVEAVGAVIVVKAGQSLAEDAVLAHCAQHLASFKVPKAVMFADTLPKNPSGKLLKRELRQHHAGLFSRERQ